MNNQETKDVYDEFARRMQNIADIRYASALLQWDQETYLPVKGAAFRGQQIATLAQSAHEKFTSQELGNLLQDLIQKDLLPGQHANVTLALEDYTKQSKYTTAFVRELSEAVNRSFHSWLDARKQNDFKRFADDLGTVVELKRKEAAILGYKQHPYDALLNEHDRGSNVEVLDKMFAQVRSPLMDLLHQVQSRPEPKTDFLRRHYPKDKQWDLGMRVLKDLGFDFEAGRQDISEHPFTVSLNSRDVRITTRINENDFSCMLWSCIHELGHALYEQGLPESEYGLPLGEAASYSIHESQSRLWENHIGRSLAFCERYLPVLREHFPQQLNDVSPEAFYGGINRVRPSLIRTEADELTYHFHVMVRYEIEKLLVEGTINTADIPTYWNEHYQRYLGVSVPDDRNGCLQDVHWSHGSFGYFPTYSQGSFYAAQFFAVAKKQVPNLEMGILSGSPHALLKWLAENVYRHGRALTSEELCLKISGEGINTNYFLAYLLDKYRIIYKF